MLWHCMSSSLLDLRELDRVLTILEDCRKLSSFLEFFMLTSDKLSISYLSITLYS